MGVLSVLLVFLSYLLSHYWWFLTSGPLVVEPMAEQLFTGYESWINKHISRQKRKRITYGLSLLGIVVASFLAFNDIYLELQTVRHDLSEAQKILAAKGPEEQARAIARLQADNVQLETELHSTQNALSVLRNSLKARRLSQEERKKFTDILAAHTGQPFGTISVAAFPSCHECMTYVYDFVNAINSIPTWAARGTGNYLINVDFSGIGIGVHDPGSPPAVVRVLADALKAAGMQFSIETLDFLSPDACMLIVGNKP